MVMNDGWKLSGFDCLEIDEVILMIPLDDHAPLKVAAGANLPMGYQGTQLASVVTARKRKQPENTTGTSRPWAHGDPPVAVYNPTSNYRLRTVGRG